jgi:prepilin-type N-terminal cleavage/methylation domain-containing protein
VSLAGAGRAHQMQQQNPDRAAGTEAGFTLVEVLFTLAVATTMMSVAIPSTRDAVDALRTATAARYLAARLSEARIGAVARSACVGLRFVPEGSDYRFTPYADGNGTGVRSLDIALGIDIPIGTAEKLGDKFPGVSVGLMNGYPDADGVAGTGVDGVRIGKAHIATMSPDGTATAGTVYVHGRRCQFAVRILGTTGRVRVMEYRPAGGGWVAR